MLARRWGRAPGALLQGWLQTTASCVGKEPVVVNVGGKGVVRGDR